jgi:hypothetical protein
MLLKSGKACQRHAINPAMFGLENDVPFPLAGWLSNPAIIVPCPTETIFGFTLPGVQA